MTVATITLDEIVHRYDTLLLDAYGVLVTSAGALPGAAAFTRRLKAARKPFFILTNDASKLPQTAADRFAGFGLAVDPDDIITSGSLLPAYFDSHNLGGASCVVLGPADSVSYVERAGGRIVGSNESFDVLVVADEAGYPLLETVDAVLSSVCRSLDRGRSVQFVLPNPDLLYPTGDGGVGLAAGSIALMLEAALEARYPHSHHRFARLGKPHGAIFNEALRRSGSRNMVMIGDQLETDIAGAAAFGIDSAWITAPVTTHAPLAGDVRPTFRLLSLD